MRVISEGQKSVRKISIQSARSARSDLALA